MTPEQWRRSRIYEPHGVETDELGPLDANREWGQKERNMAIVFAALALFGFGLVIGYSLP